MNSTEKIVQYKTLSHRYAPQLDKRVNAALKRGFELYGPPYVRDGRVWQVVVKRARRKKRSVRAAVRGRRR